MTDLERKDIIAQAWASRATHEASANAARLAAYESKLGFSRLWSAPVVSRVKNQFTEAKVIQLKGLSHGAVPFTESKRPSGRSTDHV